MGVSVDGAKVSFLFPILPRSDMKRSRSAMCLHCKDLNDTISARPVIVQLEFITCRKIAAELVGALTSRFWFSPDFKTSRAITEGFRP
jgi:hypothetical protein